MQDAELTLEHACGQTVAFVPRYSPSYAHARCSVRSASCGCAFSATIVPSLSLRQPLVLSHDGFCILDYAPGPCRCALRPLRGPCSLRASGRKSRRLWPTRGSWPLAVSGWLARKVRDSEYVHRLQQGYTKDIISARRTRAICACSPGSNKPCFRIDDCVSFCWVASCTVHIMTNVSALFD